MYRPMPKPRATNAIATALQITAGSALVVSVTTVVSGFPGVVVVSVPNGVVVVDVMVISVVIPVVIVVVAVADASVVVAGAPGVPVIVVVSASGDIVVVGVITATANTEKPGVSATNSKCVAFSLTTLVRRPNHSPPRYLSMTT